MNLNAIKNAGEIILISTLLTTASNIKAETTKKVENIVHFQEKGFQGDGIYVVQNENGQETIYSIVEELINRSDIFGNKEDFKRVFKKNIEKFGFSTLKKGDVISLGQADRNEIIITINNTTDYCIYTNGNIFIYKYKTKNIK